MIISSLFFLKIQNSKENTLDKIQSLLSKK
jgi:hypothetical protein